MSDGAKRILAVGVVVLGCVGVPGRSWAQSLDVEWANLFGDGMRLWAEDRYEDALKPLYRAYALQPEPRTLKFIIRSYDFMGHCNAAFKQLAMFEEEFVGAPPPRLQRCERPAELTIRCEQPTDKIYIGEYVQARCDQVVRLPRGSYAVRAPALDFVAHVELVERQKTTFVIKVQPTKWTRARH